MLVLRRWGQPPLWACGRVGNIHNNNANNCELHFRLSHGEACISNEILGDGVQDGR